MSQYIQSIPNNLWGRRVPDEESRVCTDMYLSPQLGPPLQGNDTGRWGSSTEQGSQNWDNTSSLYSYSSRKGYVAAQPTGLNPMFILFIPTKYWTLTQNLAVLTFSVF